jgi:hypothetical protein
LKLWNTNGDLGVGDHELNIAKAQGLARQQRGLLNRGSVDESAIGGTAVADGNLPAPQHHLAMKSGYGQVLQVDVAARSPAQAVCPQFQFNHLRFKARRFQLEFCHSATSFVYVVDY